MFTASTMASSFEAMGMAVPGSSAHPAVAARGDAAISNAKKADCAHSVAAVMQMLRSRTRSRDIMTRKAFENAITVVMALGGSTNAVLHLLALAHDAGVSLSIADFNAIARRTPLIGNLKPHGTEHTHLQASTGCLFLHHTHAVSSSTQASTLMQSR